MYICMYCYYTSYHNGVPYSLYAQECVFALQLLRASKDHIQLKGVLKVTKSLAPSRHLQTSLSVPLVRFKTKDRKRTTISNNNTKKKVNGISGNRKPVFSPQEQQQLLLWHKYNEPRKPTQQNDKCILCNTSYFLCTRPSARASFANVQEKEQTYVINSEILNRIYFTC